MQFNPFSKAFEHLGPEDLKVLREVAEGWYVEYKQAVPNALQIGKSISAFANQYGGYLFIGIGQNESNQAENFSGIPISDLTGLEQRIQQAVAQHITPVAHYEVRSIPGPAEEIGLAGGHAIVIVRVSEGQDAPYLHSSGRVYRRVGDGSDPVPETNRASLEFLWERSRRVARQLEGVLLGRPELSEAEEENAYVHLYLLADPANAAALGSSLTLPEFSSILRNPEGRMSGMSFENCFPMSGGFVARHVHDNDPFYLVTTWRYHGGGNSILTATVPWAGMDKGMKEAGLFLQGYDKANDFLSLLRRRGHRHGRILDVNILPALYAMAVQKHAALMKAEKVNGPIWAKIAVDGVWRSTPFLDNGSFMDGIDSLGVPVVQDDGFLALPGVERATLLKLPDKPFDEENVESDAESTDPETMLIYRQAGILLLITLHGLGVSFAPSLEALDDMTKLVKRAMEVQALRASRRPVVHEPGTVSRKGTRKREGRSDR